jgi:hypothetical protein
MLAKPSSESIRLPKLTLRELKQWEQNGVERILLYKPLKFQTHLDADVFLAILRLAIKHLEVQKKPTKKKGKK